LAGCDHQKIGTAQGFARCFPGFAIDLPAATVAPDPEQIERKTAPYSLQLLIT
jgi:hypothetical protein